LRRFWVKAPAKAGAYIGYERGSIDDASEIRRVVGDGGNGFRLRREHARPAASGNAAATLEADTHPPSGSSNDLKAAEDHSIADVNVVNRYGVPPLSLEATNGNAAVLELLLKAGAN
jgi:ankyrin repeat protein